MNKIFCIVGKSASGKDTIYKEIISRGYSGLIPIIPYTTRPMRAGEADGIDYHFVTAEQMADFERDKLIIEKRSYLTTRGVWSYFTLKFDIGGGDYILITTLEGAMGITANYGQDIVHIVYLTVDDKIRLLRCIERESRQNSPDYEEVCRRFIADQKDFSDENLKMFKNLHTIDTCRSLDECIKDWDVLYKRYK